MGQQQDSLLPGGGWLGGSVGVVCVCVCVCVLGPLGHLNISRSVTCVSVCGGVLAL